MDAQIIEVFKNFPKKFHVAMLPDVRASMKDEIEEQSAEADIATNELWQAKLKKVPGRLENWPSPAPHHRARVEAPRRLD